MENCLTVAIEILGYESAIKIALGSRTDALQCFDKLVNVLNEYAHKNL